MSAKSVTTGPSASQLSKHCGFCPLYCFVCPCKFGPNSFIVSLVGYWKACAFNLLPLTRTQHLPLTFLLYCTSLCYCNPWYSVTIFFLSFLCFSKTFCSLKVRTKSFWFHSSRTQPNVWHTVKAYECWSDWLSHFAYGHLLMPILEFTCTS